MKALARSAGTIVATLTVTGVLASPALGDTCAEVVRWDGVEYEARGTPFAVLEPGRELGEGEIPWCGREGGRCAPPEETARVFELDGIPTGEAIATAGGGLLLAPGTFPELPSHPLHEAIYGLPDRPDRRGGGCGEPFTLDGEIMQSYGLHRLDVAEADGAGAELAGEETWLEVDVHSRVEGFDRDGLPHVETGDRVSVQARYCRFGEGDSPVVDLIEPG